MVRLPDIRALKSFIVVAQEGNVSRASAVLNLTQPAVSLQLKKLSEDAGLTLFRRTSRGVELTREGSILLVKAEQVLSSLEEFGQTARRMHGKVRGKLRIGTILEPDFIRLGQFLAGIVDCYPDLQTELVHGMSGDVPDRILRNQIDAGFYLGELTGGANAKDEESGAQIGARDLARLNLTQFTYRVIAPAGWERKVIGAGWEELARLPWIGTPKGSVHRRLLSQLFSAHGVTQNVVALVDQEPSMLSMVRSGVGLSLCRESIALQEGYARGIVVADQVQVDSSLSFVSRQKRNDDPNLMAALEVLNSVWLSSS